MNELIRTIASEALRKDPGLVQTFDDFEAAQEELIRLLDLMGVRHVVVEAPPAGNADATFHANLSDTNR
jgi:hypothetical protein